MASSEPWGPAAPRPVEARPDGPRWRLVAAWAVAAAVAVALVAANVVALGNRVEATAPQSTPASAHAAPSPSTRAGAGASEALAEPFGRALGAYVYPDAIGPYRFVSKGRSRDHEVGYYAGTRGALTVMKRQGEALLDATEGAQPRPYGKFACWSDRSGLPTCGAQLRDGTLVVSASSKESIDSLAELMIEIVKTL